MPDKNLLEKTFLLVDDDGDDKTLFCEALSEVGPGIICYTAADGKDALTLLTEVQKKPTIIFLDINMPVMDGWQCLSRLKADPNYRDIAVIMYSTSSYQRDIDQALVGGALCFLTKPSDYRELRSILRLISNNEISALPAVMKDVRHIRFTK